MARHNLKLVPQWVPEPESETRSITDVYVSRDGMSQDEAEEQTAAVKEEIWDMLERPDCSYGDIEGILMSEGFEMDYFEDLF